MTLLQADYLTLATFVGALFRYADEGTFVSWRAFRDDTKDAPPVFIESSRIGDGDDAARLAPIADAAMTYATRAAQHRDPTVFCPPVATFKDPKRAGEIHLANGLALSVECDTHPAAARQLLEQLFGPATVAVASGGVWVDLDGGGVGLNKLHLHWRLAEPTSDPAAHALLKRARILATALVGGDATNVPVVHPIRWPGSWHRKGEPRLATILDVDNTRELVLSDALELLEAIAPARSLNGAGPSVTTGDSGSTSALITMLLSGEAMHAPLVALAYRYLKGGMADAQAVLTLRGMMDSIPDHSRNRADAPGRWEGHYKDIPRTVRTAREKLTFEGTPAPTLVDLSEFKQAFQAPAVVAARKPEIREIPTELLTPPGVLADVARYGVESAVRPVPIFAVQAALALGSIVCARRYMTSQRNYSSLYFLNIAKSGTGKEEAKTTIERILTAAGARRLIAGSSYSSGNAVFSALLRKPQHITIIDEFGKYLEAANGQRDTYKGEALTQLMEAFGRVHGDMATPQFSTMTLSSRAAADHEPRIIARPAITLLAMTTPSTFYDAMRSSRVADGFLNRFLVVEHRAAREPMAEWRDVPIPEAAIAWVKQILQPQGNLDIGTQIDHVADPVLVELNPTSLAASKAFEKEMVALTNRLESGPDGLGDMAIRANEIALRLALICSLADTPDTPIVTLDCVEWATAYVRFFLHQTIAALQERVADTLTRRVRNTILAAIRETGERGVTNWELHRMKQFIDVPKRDRVDAIDSLLQAELIVWTDVPVQGAGRPRRALIAVEEENSAILHEFRATEMQNSEASQASAQQVVTS